MSRPDLDRLGRTTPWDGVRAVVAGFGVSGAAAADNLLFLGADVTALRGAAFVARAERAHLLERLGARIRL
jgi:UDP-N-acetylmuramoylalanine--D-glutamate ligase